MATRPRQQQRTTSPGTGELLPPFSLPIAGGSGELSLRGDGKHASVVLSIHGSECRTCIEYLESLARDPAAFTDWNGRLIVVIPEDVEQAKRLPVPAGLDVTVVADPQKEFAARSGIEPAGLLIADAWGEIYHRVQAEEDGHELPNARQISDWLEFIAIQCPECEGAEGPWRDL